MFNSSDAEGRLSWERKLLGTIKFVHLNYWLEKSLSCKIYTRLYRCVMVDELGPGTVKFSAGGGDDEVVVLSEGVSN